MIATIILNPVAAVLYLIHLGVNIAQLFLLVQLILTWKRPAWLVTFGEIGKPITAAMTHAVTSHLKGRLRGRKLTERGNLLLCTGLLTLTDLIIRYASLALLVAPQG